LENRGVWPTEEKEAGNCWRVLEGEGNCWREEDEEGKDLPSSALFSRSCVMCVPVILTAFLRI